MMLFNHYTHPTPVHTNRGRQVRPGFGSHITSDQMRNGESASSSPVPRSKIQIQRRSVFREEGLIDVQPHTSHVEHEPAHARNPRVVEPKDGKSKIAPGNVSIRLGEKDEEMEKKSFFGKVGVSGPAMETATTAPPGLFPSIPRVGLIVLLICVVMPGFRYRGGTQSSLLSGADAVVIRTPELVENGSEIEGRQNSPTEVCTRWSHQTANVNGTLYIFGEWP